MFLFPISSHANDKITRYDKCKKPQQSLPCAVAFEKLKTIKNPINQKRFFDDGIHIKDDKIQIFPSYYIAQPDIDNDGVKEIIIALTEEKAETKGTLCKSKFQCPHLILQDRNTNPDKPRLRYYSTIGFSYAYGVGLSTDEIVSGYKSLRVYKTGDGSEFDIYQYDKKNDQYFNISARR